MNIVMQKYRVLGKKGEGTFSEVLKIQNMRDGSFWACKKMKQHYDSMEQVSNLREVQALRRLSPHANVLELHEVVFDKRNGDLALVCELMDMNMYELIRGRRQHLQESKIKNYMYQLIKAIDHMHRNGIFHRDVKPENILLRDDVVKLADFGSCRSVYSKQPFTEYISTRWYRAPECLLTDGFYSYKMDIWSVGCVFFEVMSLHPLFPGSNEVDQIAKIHDIIGTPDQSILAKLRNKTRGMNFNFPPKKGSGIEKLLTHATPGCKELIYLMCTYDPDERISAKQALKHIYFKDLRDADKRLAAAAKIKERQKQAAESSAKEAGSEDTPRHHHRKDYRKQPKEHFSKEHHTKELHKEHKVGEAKTLYQSVVDSSVLASNAASPVTKHTTHKDSDSETRPPSGSSSVSKATVISMAKIPTFPQQKRRKPIGQLLRKRQKRAVSMAEGLQNAGSGRGSGTLLPKVYGPGSTGLHGGSLAPAYPSGISGLPKLPNSTLNLSTISAYKSKSKVRLPKPANRSVLGSYQLPSIDRKDSGY